LSQQNAGKEKLLGYTAKCRKVRVENSKMPKGNVTGDQQKRWWGTSVRVVQSKMPEGELQGSFVVLKVMRVNG